MRTPTRLPVAVRLVLAASALLGLATLGACAGGGTPAASEVDGGGDGVTDDTTSSTGVGLPGSGDAGPPASVDGGPFCTSIRAIQDLGAGGADTGAPEQVLAQNEAMLDLLDEATATVPEGAPADVESLFDDYLSVAEAIRLAGGDIDAAYAGLQEREPQVAARLFNATAHLPAFEYFANHCGIRFQ